MFEQPVIQTAQMFIGETGCWLVVGVVSLYRRYGRGTAPEENGYQAVNSSDTVGTGDDDAASIRSHTPVNPAAKPLAPNDDGRLPLTGWKISLLSLPAICDILGTTLMNVGLLFVAASIYQMTRGALVLFVGLFSVIFLKRKLQLFQWFALVTVVFGVGIVGLAGAIYRDREATPSSVTIAREALTIIAREARTPEAVRTILGILLIAGAQIFTASQFVLEESIMERYSLEPLRVVGWEGIFGFSITLLGMIVLHHAIGRTETGKYGYFDMVEGWREITHYPAIGWSSLAIMISIG